MKFRVDITAPSPQAWVVCVMNNFDRFLQDHADCERKASAMAMSFVAKYPDRTEILPELIDTALEELEHFRDVYAIMQKKGITLAHEIEEDPYIKQLLTLCRNGRDERFLDRLILASIIECRGAERFKLVWEQLPTGELKDFYHRLWASEAKHGEVFVRLALTYFSEDTVYKRLQQLNQSEATIMLNLPIRAALH